MDLDNENADAAAMEAECIKLITCDAEGCQERNPTFICGHCQCMHYCSVECQTKHWRTVHQSDCPSMNEMRSTMANIRLGRNNHESSSSSSKATTATTTTTSLEADPDTKHRVLETNPSCGICLKSEDLKDPVVLSSCHHAFCFACLHQWSQHKSCVTMSMGTNNHRPQGSTCPLCRRTFPSLVESTFDQALLHLTKAGIEGCSPHDRQHHLESARNDMDKLQRINVSTAAGIALTDPQRVHADMIRGEIAVMMQDYTTALSLLQNASLQVQAMVERQAQIQRLMSRFRQLLQDSAKTEECEAIRRQAQVLMTQGSMAYPTDHAVVLLKIGQLHRLREDWYSALRTYQDIGTRYPDPAMLTESQHGEMLASLTQVAYQLGHYERAIYVGKATVAMNRYCAWSHKYLALAYAATGDRTNARQTAAEAVVYETPWDRAHQQQVREWYKEHFWSFDKTANAGEPSCAAQEEC